MIIKLEISPRAGYDAQQVVENVKTFTVGELREMLADFDDDAMIVTYDSGNSLGAAWGVINADQWIEEVEE